MWPDVPASPPPPPTPHTHDQGIQHFIARIVPAIQYMEESVTLAWVHGWVQQIDERMCSIIGEESVSLGLRGRPFSVCLHSRERRDSPHGLLVLNLWQCEQCVSGVHDGNTAEIIHFA